MTSQGYRGHNQLQAFANTDPPYVYSSTETEKNGPLERIEKSNSPCLVYRVPLTLYRSWLFKPNCFFTKHNSTKRGALGHWI